MTLVSLELQRARKQLQVFCEHRNAGLNSGPDWRLSEDSGCLQILLQDAVVLRLVPEQGRWRLLVPQSGRGWQAYPPRPEADNIEAVIEELEQAPLHVHW